MTVAAVIVAGGSGLRAGGERPKQYQLIGGRPVIWWTCRAFLQHSAIDVVQPVIGEGHEQMFAEATDGLDLPLPQAIDSRPPALETWAVSEDRREGPRAFAEKRTPDWAGR